MVPVDDHERSRLFEETVLPHLDAAYNLARWLAGNDHDAQDVAQIGPVGMIFVPSRGGISHAPNEYSAPQDITNGANVLLNALLKLDAAS